MQKNNIKFLSGSGSWTGVNKKINETTYVAKVGQAPKCFNCGGDHLLNECNKPKNNERIKANRKLYDKSKRKLKDKNSKTKWSKPTSEERKNNNRRMIDGKEHYYQYKTKRWKLVPENKTGSSANVVEKKDKSEDQSVETSNDNNEKESTMKLEEVNKLLNNKEALANLATLSGLLTQFKL